MAKPEEAKSENMRVLSTNPIDLLIRLGVIKAKDGPSVERQFINYPGKFEWANLATSNSQIGPTLSTLQQAEIISACRTCHMGGMHENIRRGGGRDLVMNLVVSQHNLGYPLIFDFNDVGTDFLYRPDLAHTNGHEQPAPILAWNGAGFAETQPGQVVKTPFAMTIAEGQVVPLSQFHRNNIGSDAYDGKIKYLSDRLMANENDLRTILIGLLSSACDLAKSSSEDGLADARKMLKNITDRAVRIDGKTIDSGIGITMFGKLVFGGKERSVEEAVELVLTPIRIASNPGLLHNVASFEKEYPLFSKEMFAALMAVFNMDFAQDGIDSAVGPVNPHIHLGAGQMAGAAPFEPGYFDESQADVAALISNMRATEIGHRIPPVYYVLVPMLPLTFFPSEAHPNDIAAVEELIARIHNASDNLRGKGDREIVAVAQTARDWLGEYGEKLAPYFAARFIKKAPDGLPDSPQMVIPKGFNELSWRQASIAVGALRYLGGMAYKEPPKSRQTQIDKWLN